MSPPVRNPYLIALGSNLASGLPGNRAVIEEAVSRITDALGAPRALSRFWRTPAWPPGSGPEFVNSCAALDSDLPPHDLLATLHRIEADMGRQRVRRWGPRVIDLDLLAQGQTILPDCGTLTEWIHLDPARQQQVAPEQLILPHPRLQDRAFVLVPLAEVAPDWRHPVLGLSVLQMRDALPADDLAVVVAL
jgi:2-amino-4-hydroxy-6-hydroxymethyldihydropteridine diphosphokinase